LKQSSIRMTKVLAILLVVLFSVTLIGLAVNANTWIKIGGPAITVEIQSLAQLIRKKMR
jgi:hypothetical protein